MLHDEFKISMLDLNFRSAATQTTIEPFFHEQIHQFSLHVHFIPINFVCTQTDVSISHHTQKNAKG